jgi:hypothetical protein
MIRNEGFTKMRMKTITCVALAMLVMAIGGTSAWAAPEAPLSDAGQKLSQRYAQMLADLKAELVRAIPDLSDQKRAAYVNAREAEKAAKAELEASQSRLDAVGTARALVAHAQGKWIGGADKSIAAAQAKLKQATTEALRLEAQRELAKWQENRESGSGGAQAAGGGGGKGRACQAAT